MQRRLRGHQPNAGQPAGGQVPEERQPAGAVLSGGDLQREDGGQPIVTPLASSAKTVSLTAHLKRWRVEA